MTRVLALDPGDRVGWARADVAEDGTWTDLRHGITPLREMAFAIDEALDTHSHPDYPDDCCQYDVVVCEDWRLYPDKAKDFIGSTFPSVQFVGMVRLCVWQSSAKLVMQGANTKKTADKAMKVCMPDLYAKVTTPRAHDDAHDMDALRHLFFWTFQHTTLAPKPEGVAA